MSFRYLLGGLVIVAAYAYLLAFARRWSSALRRPRPLYAALAVVSGLVLGGMLESAVARAEAPAWVIQLFWPVLLSNATLVQALPLLIGIDVALRLRSRAARRAGKAQSTPDRAEDPDPEFAGEEAERAVREHLRHSSIPPSPSKDALPEPIDESRRRAIAQVGAGLAFASFGGPLLWGSLKTRFDVELTEVPIRIARLPKALDGFSIVQVSDIHVGAFVSDRQLARAEELVVGLRPDLVVMTGDLVHARREDLARGVAWLARLRGRARHGVVGILGNHEYFVGAERALAAMRAAGIDALFNEGRVIAPGDGGGFVLVGTDDLAGLEHGRGPGPQVHEALLAMPPEAARVLLCHQPQYHPTAASYGFDLQLSGHTHGGQIGPFGPLVSKAIFGKVAGLSAIGDSRLYVNRGLGTSGPPSRVRVRPEITKIVLVAG
jgi:hypothetical protein